MITKHIGLDKSLGTRKCTSCQIKIKKNEEYVSSMWFVSAYRRDQYYLRSKTYCLKCGLLKIEEFVILLRVEMGQIREMVQKIENTCFRSQSTITDAKGSEHEE